MLTDSPTRTTAEIVGRGYELLKNSIEPTLPPEEFGRFICVDIDSGAFEVDDDDLMAIERLDARVPGAVTFLGRVGKDSTYRMGMR
jgi:hypothetical protein